MLNKMLGSIGYYIGVQTQDLREQADKDWLSFCSMNNTLEPYIGVLKGKTILDIGCGRRYPYTLLLHSLGNTVIGIDTAYVGYSGTIIERYWKELTQNGFLSLARTFLVELFGKKASYYETLGRRCNFALNYQGISIKRINAEDMAFPENTFDLAVSNECFEHIVNLPKTISELHKVLKIGGYAHIRINLFTCRSGGHHIGSQLARVPPWDHLRQNKYPVTTYLNREREGRYIALFSERFEVIAILREMDEEGEKLLTPEVYKELSTYSREELLTENLIIVFRKT